MKHEDWIQIYLIKWLNVEYPHLIYTASAGGMWTNIKTARKMKAMGYVAGCPDLLIFQWETQMKKIEQIVEKQLSKKS